jgi:ParB family chromosome partitioning protein
MAKKVERKSNPTSEKKRLGTSVRAIFSLSDQEIEAHQEDVVKELSSTVAFIPITQIEVNPFQPRNQFDDEAIAELAASIQTHGLIQPITVRRLHSQAYQLISGERRFRASQIAGLSEIPAYIRIANDQEMLEMALVENIQREDLNAIEVAITLQRLKDECSLTDELLAERMGKKRSTITNHLRLLKLPPDIQKAIKEKKITMGHARALAGIEDYAVRDSLFRKTLKEEISVRELERLVAAFHDHKPKSKKTDTIPQDYIHIQQNLRELLGTPKVQIKVNAEGKGQLILPFESVEQFNAYLDYFEK